MKNKYIFLLLLCFLVFSQVTCFSAIIMQPYLQAAGKGSIYVLAECSSMKRATVEYGETTNYYKIASSESIEPTTDSTYVHNIKLAGLSHGTLYHYRVLQDGTTSYDSTFRTLVSSGTGFRFAWAADFRTNTAIHAEIAKLILNSAPLFSLYGGDLCLDSGYGSFKKEFFLKEELELGARVPFFNAVGNHEGWTENTRAFTQAPYSKSGNQGYYSFDCGDLHVLVLNNYAPYTEGSVQYNFAKKDLADSKKTWKIVTSHKPAYCAGSHGEDEEMKVMAKNIFEPDKVDMVISGHSHFYQHNLVNGIHYMVIGSAGAPLFDTKKAPYTIKTLKDYEYAIVDVNTGSLRMVVYNDKGKELETINLTK